jgi:undecaprenyl-diphosphatase
MDLVHVIFLALLQGVTELFPVSSLGHTVLLPGLLGWKDTISSPVFLPLVVALHLGTAVALFTFFWRDWLALLRSGLRCVIAGRFTPDVDPTGYGWQFVLVVIGTFPTGAIGLLLQAQIAQLFGQPIFAAIFLVMNGIVLLTTEFLLARRRQAAGAAVGGVTMGATALAAHAGGSYLSAAGVRTAGTLSDDPGNGTGVAGKSLNQVTVMQALLIGLAQSLAFLPGISRSGATIAAGLVNGLSHEASARYSFLLATPLILGAGLLEIPRLVAAGGTALTYSLLGGLLAGIAAYLSVRFLMRYFETNRLNPFAWYCIVAGTLAFGYLMARTFRILP